MGEGLACEACRGQPQYCTSYNKRYLQQHYSSEVCVFLISLYSYYAELVCLKRILERIRLGYTDRKLLVVLSCLGSREHNFTCIVYPQYSSRCNATPSVNQRVRATRVQKPSTVFIETKSNFTILKFSPHVTIRFSLVFYRQELYSHNAFYIFVMRCHIENGKQQVRERNRLKKGSSHTYRLNRRQTLFPYFLL